MRLETFRRHVTYTCEAACGDCSWIYTKPYKDSFDLDYNKL